MYNNCELDQELQEKPWEIRLQKHQKQLSVSNKNKASEGAGKVDTYNISTVMQFFKYNLKISKVTFPGQAPFAKDSYF